MPPPFVVNRSIFFGSSSITWASNESCGVSGTGHGEYFIRFGIARSVSVLMKHAGRSVQEAADEVINGTLTEAGGTGGVIALDREGNVAMVFNTEGMYRGYAKGDGKPAVFVYGDE